MSTPQKSVFFAGVSEAVRWTVSRTLEGCGLDFCHGAWNNALFETVFTTRFNVIVACYPVPGIDFGRFLSAVRSKDSQCRNAGVILIAAPGTVEKAAAFIGRGVNRVLTETTPDLTLMENITELLQAAPRVPVRTSARILGDLGRVPKRFLFQTENISASGMLLRGWNHFPVGFTFDFELDIPGEVEPIRGRATVTRAANEERERISGLGVSFESMNGESQNRIDHFISENLHRGGGSFSGAPRASSN